MRLFKRALRRAGLPLAMSQGYNPRPRISLPAPLSVGIEGRNEVLDFELSQWVRPEEVGRRLAEELPRGVDIKAVENTAGKQDRSPTELSYRVPLLPGHTVGPEAIEELLAADELIVQRRKGDSTKEVDIRPFVAHLRVDDDQLQVLLRCTDRGTARPEEVLEKLGCQPGRDYLPGAMVRTHVNLSSSP
jgi:radical SAM-linked protein